MLATFMWATLAALALTILAAAVGLAIEYQRYGAKPAPRVYDWKVNGE